jgi:hypothetical protein
MLGAFFSKAMHLAGGRAAAVVASAIDGTSSSMECAKCLVMTMPVRGGDADTNT